jgi:hypothetical protein
MSKTDHFQVQRTALFRHAKDVHNEVEPWGKVSSTLETGSVPPSAFGVGHKFAQAYNDLVLDYASYTGRISTTLVHVSQNLRSVAESYGNAEAANAINIDDIGEQF